MHAKTELRNLLIQEQQQLQLLKEEAKSEQRGELNLKRKLDSQILLLSEKNRQDEIEVRSLRQEAQKLKSQIS